MHSNSRPLLFTPLFMLIGIIFIAFSASAGQPVDLRNTGSKPAPDASRPSEIRSQDGTRGLTSQLFRALSLVKSDVLIKTRDRISLRDPHSSFQMTCNSRSVCRFVMDQSELGWSVSESSAQAILFHALEALSKESRDARPTLRSRWESRSVRFDLRDPSSASSLSCVKRMDNAAQFNCLIRVRS